MIATDYKSYKSKHEYDSKMTYINNPDSFNFHYLFHYMFSYS